MSATTIEWPKEVGALVELFAVRFEVEEQVRRPLASTDMTNSDTSTYRKDTDDYDT